MRRTITVHLEGRQNRSYDIVIAPGAFAALPARLHKLAGDSSIFIITDSTVRRLYGRRLMAGLRGVTAGGAMFAIEPGEKSKRLGVASGLWNVLLRGGIRRDSLVVALGGGVVGDLAGFIAATVLRGVRLVQVPTTLLAQVDSSVGGKVGIDHASGKNLVGAFHQPAAVEIDPQVLRTLPVVEFRNGLAEMAKIAVALDPHFFRMLERSAPGIRKNAGNLLVPLIARAVELKAAVVERDETESGVRAVLNLGHTLGHALEAASGYRVPHGIAVAAGLSAEAELAVRLGIMRRTDRTRLCSLLTSLGLPASFPRVKKPGIFLRALRADKKTTSEGPRFSLPAGIGVSAIDVTVPADHIADVTGVRS